MSERRLMCSPNPNVELNLNNRRPERGAGLLFPGREKSKFWHNYNKTEFRKSCDSETWTETLGQIRSDQSDCFQSSRAGE